MGTEGRGRSAGLRRALKVYGAPGSLELIVWLRPKPRSRSIARGGRGGRHARALWLSQPSLGFELSQQLQ